MFCNTYRQCMKFVFLQLASKAMPILYLTLLTRDIKLLNIVFTDSTVCVQHLAFL